MIRIFVCMSVMHVLHVNHTCIAYMCCISIGVTSRRHCTFVYFLGPISLSGEILHKTPLKDDFPNTLTLMGNLIPYQHNMWLGHSINGTSTGLHHDYHDNFYFTIRGRKIFRLYSPRCAEILETVGNISKIHENGLISYDEIRRSDGK